MKKVIWKLLNNAFYGKTLENIRGRFNIEFPESTEKAKRLQSKTNFRTANIYDDEFAIYQMDIKNC